MNNTSTNYIAVSVGTPAGQHTALIHTGTGMCPPTTGIYRGHIVFYYAAGISIYAAAVANLRRCRLLMKAASASVTITLRAPCDLSLVIDIIRRTVAGMTITMTDGKPMSQFTEITKKSSNQMATTQARSSSVTSPAGHTLSPPCRITLDTVGTVVCTSRPTLIHKFTTKTPNR